MSRTPGSRVRDIEMEDAMAFFFCGSNLNVYDTFSQGGIIMLSSLPQLEQEKADLLRAFSALGDLRRGSITSIVRRCGKSTCRCAQPNDPGHGPNLRLTYKVRRKTISEALPTPIAVRKAEREIAEFRKFEQLSKKFVQVNEQLCRSRPVEETLTPQEKKLPKRFNKKSPRK